MDNLINVFANYLNGASGDFWGFLGIALAYIGTGIAELFSERKKEWQKAIWFIPGVIFIFLSINSLLYGTVKVVDAGKVLGYLGIGAGLFCLAWTMHANRKTEVAKWVVSWIIMVLGILFTLCAAVLMIPSGLVTLSSLLIIVVIALIFYAIYKGNE
jgi:hypothetical protein